MLYVIGYSALSSDMYSMLLHYSSGGLSILILDSIEVPVYVWQESSGIMFQGLQIHLESYITFDPIEEEAKHLWVHLSPVVATAKPMWPQPARCCQG